MTNASPSLAIEQLQLVRLMQLTHDFVAEWRQLFQGAMIRARTDRGRTCTVTLGAIEELLAAGVIAPGYGGSFVLTETGKAI